jgi:FMNH2-dependent dimethyl sulfone monooxygenase
MRFGLWLPIYGGWLRTIACCDAPSSQLCLDVASLAEQLGYSVLYTSENFLNCIHGPEHDVIDGWSLLAAVAARTRSIELIGAIKPGFRPALVAAQMIATVDRISCGRVGVNVVCGWWRREFDACGVAWRSHDEKYAHAAEYLQALECIWRGDQAKPHRSLDRRGRPAVWVGGHSPAGLRFAAERADVLFVNGMAPEAIGQLRRRLALALPEARRPLIAMNAFVVMDATDAAAERRRSRLVADARPELIALYRNAYEEAGTSAWAGLSDEELVEPNGGLAAGLVGSAATIAERLSACVEAGADYVICQFADVVADARAFASAIIPRFARRNAALQTI